MVIPLCLSSFNESKTHAKQNEPFPSCSASFLYISIFLLSTAPSKYKGDRLLLTFLRQPVFLTKKLFPSHGNRKFEFFTCPMTMTLICSFEFCICFLFVSFFLFFFWFLISNFFLCRSFSHCKPIELEFLFFFLVFYVHVNVN